MRLTELSEDREHYDAPDLEAALRLYEARDAKKAQHWVQKFAA